MKPLLRRRRETKDLRRVEAVGGNHSPDLGPLARQCTGLVEEHCVDLAQEVECAPVLNQDTFLRT